MLSIHVTRSIMFQRPHICVFGLLISAGLWFSIFYLHFGVPKSILVNHEITKSETTISQTENPKPDNLEVFPFMKAMRSIDNKSDPCGGRYVYLHDLPSRFNKDLVKECGRMFVYDMCKFTPNNGFGCELNDTADGVFSENGWYATGEYTLDLIFHTRMEQYECLTNDSSMAAAIFVPFYAGLDFSRYLVGYNTSTRDATCLDLDDWLQKRDEWKRMNGKDHFIVGGRTTWDFRRPDEFGWGNNLWLVPATRNMSKLFIESSLSYSNDFAIPYPTNFHPSKDSDVFNWQYQVMQMERKWLFCFAGVPRPNDPKSIRSLLIDQCKNSSVGKHLECGIGEIKCRSPSSIMNMFKRSIFCLQPKGDTPTRRSAFDSILAGCIPVFFHPDSFYTQYTWHVPINYTRYSVFISEDDIRMNVSIEQHLSQIDPINIKMMREEVINLIPRVIYARSKLETLKDAFDVSIEEIINKVRQWRQNMIYERWN